MFTRKDTKAVKGIAILLMFIHHLWAFPDRLPSNMQLAGSGVMVNGTDLVLACGGFGKICVAIFMFLGGYGLWEKRKQEYSLASDLWRLYIALWKVAVIFIPLGFLFFSGQPDYANEVVICHVFDHRNISTIVSNFLGLSCSYNREWWFFFTYLGALVAGAVFLSVDKIRHFWTDAFVVVLMEIVTQKIIPVFLSAEKFPALHGDRFFLLFLFFDASVCTFFMGIVFAKYNALVGLRARFHEVIPQKAGRLLAGGIGLCCIFVARQFCTGGDFDMVYVPFFIVFALEWFDAAKPVRESFYTLGKYSTNMWLIHGFYCYYFYPVVKVVCWSGNAPAALLTLLFLSLVSAVAVEWFWKIINRRPKKSL